MRLSSLLSVVVLVPWIASPATAQSCSVVADINTTATPLSSNPSTDRFGPGGSAVTGMVKVGSYWYFTATTRLQGKELWRTDGTAAGTTIVRNIYRGTPGSNPRELVACNGRLFFTADNGRKGRELWSSDGTSAGTQLVRDIRLYSDGSNPASLTCMGGKVYFAADDGVHGRELWCSDGTQAGTVLVKDIAVGAAAGDPRYLIANPAGNLVYFRANDGTSGVELWRTDGTAAGTVLVRDIHPGTSSSTPGIPRNLGSWTLFSATDATAGSELWRTDGTSAGTTRVLDIAAGPTGSSVNLQYAAEAGGFLYFSASDGVNGRELWRTDGTSAGTTMVADIRSGSSSSNPTEFAAHGTDVYFSAYGGSTIGYELHRWNGTTAALVKDIDPGSRSSRPKQLLAVGSAMYFVATTLAQGLEVYVTYGTAAGTRLVIDHYQGSTGSSPWGLTAISTTEFMFFANRSGPLAIGRELYKSNGSGTGTRAVLDINPGTFTGGSTPSSLSCADGKTLYFRATNGFDIEPRKTDANGTALVHNINPTGSSYPDGFLTFWNGTESVTVFSANDGQNGAELWRTDGTPTGTSMILDIEPGPGASVPRNFTRCRNQAFFTATTRSHGTELWATDGTASGTRMVRNIMSSGSSSPRELTCCQGKLFFVANDGNHGEELWTSDGTLSGTVMVADLRPGTDSSSIDFVTCLGDRVFFRGYTLATGVELFASDGTAAGTGLVADLAPGGASSRPNRLVPCGNTLFFVATVSAYGDELWKSDGTGSGTVLVADLNPGTDPSSPTSLTCVGNKLFFSAYTASTGTELFVSDGTTAGTTIVADLLAGATGSYPQDLFAAGGGLFFSAQDNTAIGGTGRELYFSDGTAAGTGLFFDIFPGHESSNPRQFTLCDGVVYFAANDGLTGVELYRIDGTLSTVERVGSGCGVTLPRLDCTDVTIAQLATIRAASAPTTAGLLMIGAPASPTYVPNLVAPGCAIRADLAFFELFGQPGGTSWDMTLPTPNDPSLEGVKLMMQSVYGPTPLSLSNGVQLVIGK